MALYENTIRLKGFAGKNAVTKTTAKGGAITVFSLATQSSYKDKQSSEWVSRTEWHRIVCFGKPAEYAKELKQGDYVEVEGELRSSEYDAESGSGNDKNNDQKTSSSKRRSWEVRASRIRRLDRPASSGSQSADQGKAA